MDDEFGPTAEWDWGDQDGPQDTDGEKEINEVCVTARIQSKVNVKGSQSVRGW